MFSVKNNETGEIWTVYGVSGIRFLLWDGENKCWKYDDIEKYSPAEENNGEKETG